MGRAARRRSAKRRRMRPYTTIDGLLRAARRHALHSSEAPSLPLPFRTPQLRPARNAVRVVRHLSGLGAVAAKDLPAGTTLVCERALAMVLDAQGRYPEAEAEFRAALTLRQDALDPKHPDIATSRHNLANVLGSQGKYEEAEAEHRALLVEHERVDVLGEGVAGHALPDALVDHDDAGPGADLEAPGAVHVVDGLLVHEEERVAGGDARVAHPRNGKEADDHMGKAGGPDHQRECDEE